MTMPPEPSGTIPTSEESSRGNNAASGGAPAARFANRAPVNGPPRLRVEEFQGPLAVAGHGELDRRRQSRERHLEEGDVRGVVLDQQRLHAFTVPGRLTGGESRRLPWAQGRESLASGPIRVKRTPVSGRPLYRASRGGIIHGLMDIVIRCRDLRKVYDGKPPVEALRGLDLEVGAGECFGILGPNGAGKTTTVEILEGILAASSGDVEVLGLRWGRGHRALRERIGVSLQETRLADKLTVEETLELFASFYRKGRPAEEVMTEVGLTEKRSSWVVKLSGGQRQRLPGARAVPRDPGPLFLGQPPTGLAPPSRPH